MHLIADFGPEKYCSVFYKNRDEAQQNKCPLVVDGTYQAL